MASVHSREENDFIRQHVTSVVTAIGLSRQCGGDWRWTDGTPLDWTNWCPHEHDVHRKDGYAYTDWTWTETGALTSCWVRLSDPIKTHVVCKLPVTATCRRQ